MRKRSDRLPQRRQPQNTRSGVSGVDSASSATFRRNQTLNSYRSRPLDEDSARRRTHELNRLRRRIVAALVAVVVLAGLVLFGLWQFTSSVVVTAQADGREVDFGARARVFTEEVNKYYAQNPLERFRLLLREGDLISFLQQTTPEVESLESLSASGLPSRLTLRVNLRRPVAAWTVEDKTFYVDGGGKSFEYNYFERPTLNVFDENDAVVRQSSVASNRFLQTIGRLVTDLGERGLAVDKLIIPRNLVRQVDVLVQGSAIRFKLSVDRSPAEQAEDVARVLRWFAERGQTPEYVDLRVEQKAYFK